MRSRTGRFGITVGSLFVLIVFLGCATTSPQLSSRPAPKLGAASPQVATLATQPSWLLTGDRNVPASENGDILHLDSAKVSFYGFEVVSYEPQTDPMMVTFWGNDRITYWKGKGEITKLSTGERVLVPLMK